MALRPPAFLVLLLVLACAVLAHPQGARAAIGPDSKRNCIYTAHRIDNMRAFGQMVGHDFDCALVYTAPPDWAAWEAPWFIGHPDPNVNWAKWKRAQPGRDLIVTQGMIPNPTPDSDWLQKGARGDYDEHARALARNLVAAGLGDSVIRLSHEMNGTWYNWSLPSSDADLRLWAQFWRREALAMKSVPGANFKFDWCLNAGVRPIELSKFYPGDDVVDFVGVDAYDVGFRSQGAQRWSDIYNRAAGLGPVLAFAKAHGKALSVPEWGIGPANDPGWLSAGDDPTYVKGIADVVRDNRVAYQAYFYNHEWATQLAASPQSLDAYRAAFGTPSGQTDAPAQTTAPRPAPTQSQKPASAPARPAPTRTPARAPASKPVPRLRVAVRRKRLRGHRVRLSVRVVDEHGHPARRALIAVAGRRMRADRRGRAGATVRLRPGRRYRLRARLGRRSAVAWVRIRR